MGAPITAYNRISDNKIRIHSNIYEPDYVVVVDESLIKDVDVAAGLKKDGAILVNTQKEPAEIKKQLKGFEGKVYTVDAMTISIDALGKYSLRIPYAGGDSKGERSHD